MTRTATLWLWIAGGIFLLYLIIMVIGSSIHHTGRAAINYKRLVCPDAWQHDIQEPQGNHFTVKLHEGCFSGFITIPKGWHQWNFQQVGNDPSEWSAFWFAGANDPEGPFPSTARINFAYHPTQFRLQGKEGQELLFYTSERNPISQDAPKSDENGVYKVGSGVTEPKVIFKIDPTYTKEALAAHFNDSVKVSLVVNERGFAKDIVIENSPGYGMDEQIIDAVHRWVFKPGTKDGKPVPVKATIVIDFHSH